MSSTRWIPSLLLLEALGLIIFSHTSVLRHAQKKNISCTKKEHIYEEQACARACMHPVLYIRSQGGSREMGMTLI